MPTLSAPVRGRYPIPSPDGYCPAELESPNAFTQPNTFQDDLTVEGTLVPTGGLSSFKLSETIGASSVTTQDSTHGLATLVAATQPVSTLAVDKDTKTVMVSLATSDIPPSAPPQVPVATIYSSEINIISLTSANPAVVTTSRSLVPYGIDAAPGPGGDTFKARLTGVTASAWAASSLAFVNDTVHTCTRTGDTTFTIPTNATIAAESGDAAGGYFNPIQIATMSNHATDPVFTVAGTGNTIPSWFVNGVIVKISGVVTAAPTDAQDVAALALINDHYFAITVGGGLATNQFSINGVDTDTGCTGPFTGGEVAAGQFSITGTINDTVNWWVVD